MIKISTFSKLSNLSIRVLRHYDEIGLLKPYYIDESNGYRYYEAFQLKRTNQISKLKYLGFSLSQIKDLLNNDNLDIQKQFFELRKQEVSLELENLSIQASLLDKASNIVDFKEDRIMNFHVVLEEFKSLKVIAAREVIPSYQDEGVVWNKLAEYINDKKVAFNQDTLSIALYWDEEYKEKDVDVEVAMSVSKDYPSTNYVKCYDLSSYHLACVTFNGSYDLMSDVVQAIALWIEDNGYMISGPMINFYHVSHLQDPNPDNWITKACYVVKKIR